EGWLGWVRTVECDCVGMQPACGLGLLARPDMRNPSGARRRGASQDQDEVLLAASIEVSAMTCRPAWTWLEGAEPPVRCCPSPVLVRVFAKLAIRPAGWVAWCWR